MKAQSHPSANCGADRTFIVRASEVLSPEIFQVSSKCVRERKTCEFFCYTNKKKRKDRDYYPSFKVSSILWMILILGHHHTCSLFKILK